MVTKNRLTYFVRTILVLSILLGLVFANTAMTKAADYQQSTISDQAAKYNSSSSTNSDLGERPARQNLLSGPLQPRQGLNNRMGQASGGNNYASSILFFSLVLFGAGIIVKVMYDFTFKDRRFTHF